MLLRLRVLVSLLRAESVRGQLDGTIPATSQGQAQDNSVLIDADELIIADMGTMDHTMGGRSPGGNGHTDDFPPRGRQGDIVEAFNPQNDFVPPNNSAPSGEPATPNGTVRPGNFAPPDIQNGSPANNTVSLVLLGISIGILIFGLMTVLLFRRRQ